MRFVQDGFSRDRILGNKRSTSREIPRTRIRIQRSMAASSTTVIALVIILILSFGATGVAYAEDQLSGTDVQTSPESAKIDPSLTNVSSTSTIVEHVELKGESSSLTSPVPSAGTYVLYVVGVAIAAVGLAIFWRKGGLTRRLRWRAIAPLGLSILILLPVPAAEAQSASLTRWTLPTTGTDPFLPSFNYIQVSCVNGIDSAGNVWFIGGQGPAPRGDNLYRLSPVSNEFTRFKIPNVDREVRTPGACGSVVDRDGRVWFTDFNGNKVGRFDPATNIFSLWTIPSANSYPWGISVDSGGTAYFTEYQGNKIGRLNPITSEMTEWTIPTPASAPYPIMVEGPNRVWFAEVGGNKIGRLDPEMNTITEFTVPTPDSQPFGLFVHSGQVWFSEFNGRKIGRLVPEPVNEVTEWSTNFSDIATYPIYALVVDVAGNPWSIAQSRATGGVHLLVTVDTATNVLTRFDLDGYFAESLNSLAIDASFDPGALYLGSRGTVLRVKPA